MSVSFTVKPKMSVDLLARVRDSRSARTRRRPRAGTCCVTGELQVDLIEPVRPEAPHACGPRAPSNCSSSPRLIRLRIGKGVDLVARRDLPRQRARRLALQPFLPEGRPIQVGRVERRALRRVEVDAGDLVLAAGEPGRREEPQPVPLDRTAHVEVRVVEVLDVVDRRHAAARARRRSGCRSAGRRWCTSPSVPTSEGVAAFLRHEVDAAGRWRRSRRRSRRSEPPSPRPSPGS